MSEYRYEYAVSAGEGTLIEHGSKAYWRDLLVVIERALDLGHTCIFEMVKVAR